MPALKTPTEFITFDDLGRAVLAGTNTKVIEIALDHSAHGWSPQEIYFQHYREISLAQIHAALSFYFEHQADFDAEIERQLREFEKARLESGESPFASRARQEGKLSQT
ncbi:MAG: DUF433 domain-containing protein [Isosphaeraceae bacterium]